LELCCDPAEKIEVTEGGGVDALYVEDEDVAPEDSRDKEFLFRKKMNHI